MRHKKGKEKTERETDGKKDEEEESDSGDTEEVPAAEDGDSPVDDEGAVNEEIDNLHCKPGQKKFRIFLTKKQS